MSNPPLHPSVRDAEFSFLRKGWWLFPVLGALASLAWGGPFWQWVEGRPPWPLDWTGLFTLRGLLVAAMFLLIPIVWRWTLNIRVPKGIALLVAGAGVVAIDLFLRSGYLQVPLWLAARSRLEADQHFMREVCYVRLEEVAGRQNPSPGIVLVGSSQVLCGVDEHLLRNLVQPVPVIRRAVFGMTPLKALSMMTYVPYRPDDVCVQYLSEMDFTNQDEFPYAWFRPMAAWQTLPDVMRCVSLSVRIRHWRHVVDYLLAASLESWRMRDFIRQIVFHFWRAEAPAGAESQGKVNLPQLVDRARTELAFAPAERKAFTAYADALEKKQVRLLIFEGDVNPALHSEHRLQAKKRVREDLIRFASTGMRRYVAIDEQNLELTGEHWQDYSHLNSIGRERFTRCIAREWGTP